MLIAVSRQRGLRASRDSFRCDMFTPKAVAMRRDATSVMAGEARYDATRTSILGSEFFKGQRKLVATQVEIPNETGF